MYGQLSVSFRLFVQHRIWIEEDREEIVQDALVTIMQKYKSLTIETSFSAWAYMVLKNKMLDYFKTRKLHAAKMDQYQRENPGGVWEPDPELQAKLKDCFTRIHRLHDRHARVLNLHYQGYTTDEICSRMNISQSNLYVILSRARKMLELCLREGDIEP